MEKILRYTVDSEDVFEHIIKEDAFEYNHVVIKPHFTFPAHPTDANVIITVIKGELSIKLENQAVQIFVKGQVITADQGTMSELSNNMDKPCELFVIKRRDLMLDA